MPAEPREMKVLHVIPSVGMADGGPSRAIRLITRGLCSKGLAVDVASTDDDGRGGCLDREEIMAVQAEFNPAGLHLFHRSLGFYKVSLALRAWLVKHIGDYDIVHIHGLFSWSSTVAARVAYAQGVPYIIRPLGSLNRYGIHHHRPWLKKLSMHWIERRMLANAFVIHFTDQRELIEASETGLAFTGRVIPLGVEHFVPAGDNSLATLYPGLAGKRIVLFLSRIAEKKNIESLLQSWRSLTGQFADIHLVIAGNGQHDYVAGLKNLAARLDIDNSITWTGHVEGETKQALLGGAWLFVLPSFSENFGIAVVEAMSAGLPCVLGEGVALSGVVAEAGAGLRVAPTADAVAEGVARLLRDTAGHDAMGGRALALVSTRYSVDAMANALVALYREIADAP
jgi:glycosyltransferase involved in cell wall biosynthesis